MTAKPQRLGIVNAFMYAGALVGENAGTISGVFVTGKVTAENVGSVGGLVGRGVGGTIRNSYAMVRVKGGPNTGGLTGDGNPVASYATGTVLGKDTPSSRNETLGGWSAPAVRPPATRPGACGRQGPSGAAVWWATAAGTRRTAPTATGTRTPRGSNRHQRRAEDDGRAAGATGYSGIYATWNVDFDDDGTNDDPWTSAPAPSTRP